MPISPVRSTTLTSMMFMITIPPTPRLTDDTSSMSTKAARLTCFHRSCSTSWVRTPNGSGSRKLVWRAARSRVRTSSTEASSPATPPLACTWMFRESLAAMKFLR